MNLKDLHNNNKSGFKIPADYFDNLEDSILNEAKLADQVSEHGFKVPDQYFDGLEDQIIAKLDAKPKLRTLNLKPWIYAASIAACLTLIFTLSLSHNETHSISSITNDTLESFILTEELNTTEMATLITDNDMFETEILNNTISDASIDYYVESEVELEDLLDN